MEQTNPHNYPLGSIKTIAKLCGMSEAVTRAAFTAQFPRGSFGFIAKACGCSPYMVRAVLTGQRLPKTARAKKTILIIKKSEEMLRMLGIIANN